MSECPGCKDDYCPDCTKAADPPVAHDWQPMNAGEGNRVHVCSKCHLDENQTSFYGPCVPAIDENDMSQWTRVEKRLPKLQKDVLYVVTGSGHGGSFVVRGCRGSDGHDWFWCDEDGDFDDIGNDGEHSYVSHWMPTPVPPRKRSRDAK